MVFSNFNSSPTVEGVAGGFGDVILDDEDGACGVDRSADECKAAKRVEDKEAKL